MSGSSALVFSCRSCTYFTCPILADSLSEYCSVIVQLSFLLTPVYHLPLSKALQVSTVHPIPSVVKASFLDSSINSGFPVGFENSFFLGFHFFVFSANFFKGRFFRHKLSSIEKKKKKDLISLTERRERGGKKGEKALVGIWAIAT